jgi:outer membrane protein
LEFAMKLAFSILIVLPAILSAQQPTDAGFTPIALPDAVALAEKNSPAAVQARGAIENAQGTVSTTYNQFFPTLSASLGHSQGAGQVLDNSGKLIQRISQPQYSTGLNTSYTVFDGGKRVYDLRARKADLASAEVSEAATKFSIALQVKQQYYAILAARESESAARGALDLANQQLAASIVRVRAGAVIISDSLRSFLAVNTAQLNLLTAQNSVRNSSLALTRLVESATPVTATAADTSTLGIAPIDSVAIVGLALDGPSVLEAQAALNSANAGVKSARTSYFPTLTASLRYGGNGYDPAFGIGGGQLAYSNTLTVSANYNIWDGRNRAVALDHAQVAVEGAGATVRDAKLLAQQNILLQISTLRDAEERIRIQHLSVEAAQEDLRVQQQRYNMGSSTQLDVTTSENALITAQQALIQARLDYRTARAQIEAIIGRDLK